MNFKKLVKSIQTAGYNGARTVPNIPTYLHKLQCFCLYSAYDKPINFNSVPTLQKIVLFIDVLIIPQFYVLQ